jgi:hypothetical protein
MKPWEPWGQIQKINFYLVYLVDVLRHNLGSPIYVTKGTQGKHLSTWHDRGLAIDACIDSLKVHPLNVILQVTRLPFTGFGIIPNAEHPLCTQAFGIHIDVRPATKIAQPQARWIWNDWKQYPMDLEHLRKFRILI